MGNPTIHSEQSVLYAPDIQRFQSAASYDPNEAIPVKPGEGWLLIIKKNGNYLAGYYTVIKLCSSNVVHNSEKIF